MPVVEAVHERRRVRPIALAMIVAGAVMLGIMAGVATGFPREFFRGYLLSIYFWVGFPLGCAMIRMTQVLTGGRWGPPIKPYLNAAIATLPLMFLAWVAIMGFLGQLYPWYLHPPGFKDPLMGWRAMYLMPWFYVMRFFIYWTIFLSVGWVLVSPRVSERWVYRVSAGGLVAYWLAMTFGFTDWIQTLEPDWYSTAYGAYQIVGQCLQALAFIVAIQAWQAWRVPDWREPYPHFLRALGGLVLAILVLLAYLSFSQFLIIWMGNLPDEVTWYTLRTRGVWGWVIIVIGLCQLWLPFFALLQRVVKEHGPTLFAVTATIVVMRGLDVTWTVLPAFGIQAGNWPATLGMAGGCLMAVGAIWLGAFMLLLNRFGAIGEGGQA